MKLIVFFILLTMGMSANGLAAVSKDARFVYPQDVLEYLNNGDIKSAIIKLKNIVRVEPKNPQYRVALADLYLAIRNVVSAEKEYMRALELGIDPSKIIISLSKTRLLQHQYQKVLDTLHEQDVSEEKKSETYLLIGKAHQGLNDLDKALEYYEKGEKIDNKDGNISIAIAQIYYFLNKRDMAEKKTDETLALNPKNIMALVLKGELTNLRQGPRKSLPYFEQALEFDPNNISALFKSAALLYDMNRIDEALDKLSILFSMVPNHPLANYLSAVIYVKRNDHAKAEEYLNSTGTALDNFPGALILRGIMNYSTQNYAQAVYFLDKLLNLAPNNLAARRLMGASLLHQDNAGQAIKALMPIVDGGSAGSVVYALLGSAHMKMGHFEEGTNYYEKAVELKPNENELRTQLALSNLAAGDANAAQKNLQKVLEEDPNSKQATVFMALISLREKKFDEAIVYADALIKQFADNPIGYNLKGVSYMGQGKNSEARKLFAKALEVSPSYYSAYMNMALLEERSGNYDKALEIHKTILKSEKNHSGALLALARGYKKKREYTLAEDYYRHLTEAAPNNIRARIEFSEFFLLQQKPDRAKAVAQQIIIDFPNQPSGYEASGNIDLKRRDFASAVINFERMATILEDNAEAYRILGRAHIRAKNISAARNSFKKAMALSGNKDKLLIELIGIEAMDANFEKARSYIEQLRKIDNKNAIAYVLEGRLLALQAKHADSLKNYLKASELGAKGSRFTVDIARSYIKNDMKDKALNLMHSWLKDNKGDRAVRHILAGYYLRVEAFDNAITQYELILDGSSTNAIALNNIAWLYDKTGQDKKALSTAQSAYNLFPNEAAFIDTYAWILVKQGENEKGLKLLKKAISKDPKMTEVRYHLAVALKNSGSLSVAKKELEQAISSGDVFQGLEDARKLLNELSQ